MVNHPGGEVKHWQENEIKLKQYHDLHLSDSPFRPVPVYRIYFTAFLPVCLRRVLRVTGIADGAPLTKEARQTGYAQSRIRTRRLKATFRDITIGPGLR